MTFPLRRYLFRTGPLFSTTFPRFSVIFQSFYGPGDGDIVLYVGDR